MLLGSTSAKAVQRMLMKLILGADKIEYEDVEKFNLESPIIMLDIHIPPPQRYSRFLYSRLMTFPT